VLKDTLSPKALALFQKIALAEPVPVTDVKDFEALTVLFAKGLVVLKGAHLTVDWKHVPRPKPD